MEQSKEQKERYALEEWGFIERSVSGMEHSMEVIIEKLRALQEEHPDDSELAELIKNKALFHDLLGAFNLSNIDQEFSVLTQQDEALEENNKRLDEINEALKNTESGSSQHNQLRISRNSIGSSVLALWRARDELLTVLRNFFRKHKKALPRLTNAYNTFLEKAKTYGLDQEIINRLRESRDNTETLISKYEVIMNAIDKLNNDVNIGFQELRKRVAE